MTAPHHPLSHVQQGIYHTEITHPNEASFNIGGLMSIKGPLDIDCIKKSMIYSLRKHATMRIKLSRHDGEVRQYVSEAAIPDIPVIDLRSKADPLAALYEWAYERFASPLALHDDYLYEFTCFMVADDHVMLYSAIHHIISDGWSFGLLAQGFFATYFIYLQGGTPEQPEITSYLDYVRNEQRYLASKRIIADRSFWMDYLQDLPEHCLRRQPNNLSARSIQHRLSERHSAFIESLVEQHQVSLNVFFSALTFLYLYQLHGETDLVIGQPIFNRKRRQERNTTGQFTSDIPLRVNLAAKQTFAELMLQVRKTLLKTYKHQQYPLDLLQDDFELSKRGFSNFFQVLVNYYNTMQSQHFGNLVIEFDEFFNHSMSHALQINIKKMDGDPQITLYINNHDHDREHLAGKTLVQHLENIIDALMQAAATESIGQVLSSIRMPDTA